MRRRATTVIALASALAIGAPGLAWGLVTIYDNDFKSRAEFRAIKKMSGSKACKTFHDKNTRLGVSIAKGPAACKFATPVQGDRSGPDHEVEAKAKVNKATSSKVRSKVYVGVGVRTGKKTGYELRVFPHRQRWELHRNPSNNDDFPVKGKLESINKIGKKNVLAIRAFGDDVTASVNGERVVHSLKDSNAAQVDGRRTTLVVSNGKKAKKPVKATFDDVQVLIPDP